MTGNLMLDRVLTRDVDVKSPSNRRTTWMVLSDESDPSTVLVSDGLKSRGIDVFLVALQEFTEGKWTHEISGANAHWVLTLRNGSKIDSRNFRGVLTLYSALPAVLVADIIKNDRAFAYNEFAASICSMLHAIEGVLYNPVWPLSLNGSNRSLDEWRAIAHKNGLPVASFGNGSSYEFSLDDAKLLTVFVVDGQVISDSHLSDELAIGIKRMAKSIAERMFSIYFTRDNGGLMMSHVDVAPDLRRGGTRVLDALARGLRNS